MNLTTNAPTHLKVGAATSPLKGAWYNHQDMTIKAMRFAACVLALLVWAGPRAAAQSSLPRSPQTIDLNTAPVALLQTLPGVNLDVAKQIVAHRPYDSVEQFRTKSGLSASQVDKLAPLVSAQPPGPIRQPHLPPGAVRISPEEFSRGFTPPSSRSPGVPGVPPGLAPGGTTTRIPVPPGTVRKIPVPKGTVTENIPVPGATSPARPVRNTRAALLYAAAAVTLALAVIVWMRRTSPTRKAPQPR